MSSGAGGGGAGVGVGLDGCSSSDTSGCYSPQPHDVFYHQQPQPQPQQQQQQHHHPHHHHQQQHQPPQQQHQQPHARGNGHKLSLQTIERYDEALSCCLPPPSPAPNSDRCMVVGLATAPATAASMASMPCDGSCSDNYDCGGSAAAPPKPSQPQPQPHHHHHQQISLSSSTLSLGTNGVGAGAHQMSGSNSTHSSRTSGTSNNSPSGRYGRLAERFAGDAGAGALTSPPTMGVPRFAPSAAHFLNQGATPLMSSDTYAYLSSTVHTPVKRYVPTPPLTTNEFYPDPAAGKAVGLGLYGAAAPAKASFHMKCCLSEHQHAPSAADGQADGGAGSDYYDTLPAQRQRGLGCDKYCGGHGGAKKGLAAKEALLEGQAPGGAYLSLGPKGCAGEQPQRPMQGGAAGARFLAQAPPEYAPLSVYKKSVSMEKTLGGGRAGGSAAADGDTGVPMGGSYEGSGAGGGEATAKGAAAATCLHCNTVRRTTGVHQTTQTTGPISPIPSLPHITAHNNQYGGQGGGCEELVASLNRVASNGDYSPMSGSPPAQADAHGYQAKGKGPQTGGGNACHQQQQQQQPPVQQHHLQQAASLAPMPQEGQQLEPSAPAVSSMPQQQLQQQQPQQPQQPQPNLSRKKRFSNYVRKEIAIFFGIDEASELEEYAVWQGRQRRFAVRRFGPLKGDGGALQTELSRSLCHNHGPGLSHNNESFYRNDASDTNNGAFQQHLQQQQHHPHHLQRPAYQHGHTHSERPDVLPAQDSAGGDSSFQVLGDAKGRLGGVAFQVGEPAERKPSVAAMIMSCFTYILHALHQHRSPAGRASPQWSRSIAPRNVTSLADAGDIREGVRALQEEELFFDTPSGAGVNGLEHQSLSSNALSPGVSPTGLALQHQQQMADRAKGLAEHSRPMYIVGERLNGWRTSSLMSSAAAEHMSQKGGGQPASTSSAAAEEAFASVRGKRISPQLLDGVLENSRRPLQMRVKMYAAGELDERPDYRPFFTYWINTVQILVVLLSIVCYGVGPIGVGVDQRTGQVLVTSLSLQTVQHTEQRNIWVGPRNNDLVHMGAKFATCMRRDVKIMNVLLKTRRQERETACCIRNDDSGCVQSSQADCSVRGLFPTKSISTWKKWSPGESGPGGRISGSVCGLDPKYCDAPASIAPYEWPDDITKWPICRKTNSFSHRFRYKDHTAEHMVCEVIGHPCCTGVYGECRITTREYCDFVNGYFHEEASLCSQISCLNNVCGMFPFLMVEVPDQFYRLFTSLCLHAGVLHLIISVAFQHVYLADLERLIGPLRTAIVYIGAGLAGNLTSAVLVPYKPEVGPLASLVGVVASLTVLLVCIHWKHLRKPYVALFKLLLLGAFLFAVGTLPWQLNFAGLIAGTLCASLLTLALVPFVSINKYKRKSKINLIWFCIIIHSILYSIMFVVFYVFPMELTNFNFGEVFNNNFNPIVISNSADYISSSMSNKNARYPAMQQQQQQQPPQHYYHHQSNDIINNAASLADGSNLAVNKFV